MTNPVGNTGKTITVSDPDTGPPPTTDHRFASAWPPAIHQVTAEIDAPASPPADLSG
ncbi:MAG: hypothetical protein ABWY11_10565 [Umezawaea sp.]